jgi:hypothetical protein|tara:strand:- start:2332 stop:2811 length:480 start_codon:yes stop_codon:yes gene_type:complete
MAVAEILAGIALVKSSVEFIKSNINTAKDIGEIAGAIDGLFTGTEECNKARNKKSGIGMGDQFGIKSVAQEVIDAKLAEEKMNEMRNMIDMRFGPGTWQSIVDERAKRIQEAKEKARAERAQKLKEQEEFWEQMKMVAIIGGVSIFMIFAFIWIFTSGL